MEASLKKLLIPGAAAIFATTVQSADHLDSPSVIADPASDINDLYTWVSADGEKLNLIMTVNPFATGETKFSTANKFVFHVNSGSDHASATTETQVVCKFYSEDGIECWAGDSYVEGDPSVASGIMSEDGDIKVFAGLRNDPFFMEFTGFTQVTNLVRDVVEANGVPGVGDCAATVAALGASGTDSLSLLRTQLQSSYDSMNETSGPAADTFAGANVMALVVQVDLSLVNEGGDALKIWGSTNL